MCAAGRLNVNKGYDDGRYGYTLAFMIVTVFFKVICALRNPGEYQKILPPESKQKEKSYQNEPPFTTTTDTRTTVNMYMTNTLATVKYCSVCSIYRPPRTVHCKCCNRCVSQFDHHCTLLGTCIGRNNYRSFFLFLFSGSILTLQIMVYSLRIFLQFDKAEYELYARYWIYLGLLILINLVNLIVVYS